MHVSMYAYQLKNLIATQLNIKYAFTKYTKKTKASKIPSTSKFVLSNKNRITLTNVIPLQNEILLKKKCFNVCLNIFCSFFILIPIMHRYFLFLSSYYLFVSIFVHTYIHIYIRY